MPLTPEIRGLYLMAIRACDSKQYETALQYFTLALRKYLRNRSERHRNVLSDPITQILTVNSCVVLCHMGNFGDAFALLDMTCISALGTPVLFIENMPLQLVPLILKIVSLCYLHQENDEAKLIAVKYLQLIRIHYQPLIVRQVLADDAAILFLTESLLNIKVNIHESLTAFHSALLLLAGKSFQKCYQKAVIGSLILKICAESPEHACSLSKDEVDSACDFMEITDVACFLNALGVSHAFKGRSLLAVEALERSLNLIKGDDLRLIITKSCQHRHIRTYMDNLISNNLSVCYHMLDVNQNYRCHWQSLINHACSIIEDLMPVGDNKEKVPALFWILRFSSHSNKYSHLALASEYKTARRGFSSLYNRELPKLIENCGKTALSCGVRFLPELGMELLEIIGMLLAASENFDESWRTFLICFDEAVKAADLIGDSSVRQAYMSAAYSRLVDKMDRCHPPSKTQNREFEEIRQLRLQAFSLKAASVPPASFSSSAYSQQGSLKISPPVAFDRSGDSKPQQTPPSKITRDHSGEMPTLLAENTNSTTTPNNDNEQVVDAFKNALQLQESSKTPLQKKSALKKACKKQRSLVHFFGTPSAPVSMTQLKASPYYSSELNLLLSKRKSPLLQYKLPTIARSLSDFRSISSSVRCSPHS